MGAVLFDFDGTLFMGTAKLNEWCFAQALQAMRLPEATDEKIAQSVGLTFRDIARLMTDSEDVAVLDEFAARTFEFVPRYIDRWVRPDPHVQAMLAALKRQAKLAVCSNAAPSYLLPMLDALALTPFFDAIHPFAEGYRKATAIPMLTKRLGETRAVFVGDRLEDVSAAREAGIPVVGIRNAVYPRETDGADRTANNFVEMQAAIEALLTE